MSPRAYRQERRAAAQAATREQIVRATVALHAERGALGTSYAMIAERAGVAPQTVYNHFPTLDALIGGCTGHVIERAPVLDESCFADSANPATRLRRLAHAVHAQITYMEPWLRLGWTEADSIPALRAVFNQSREQLRALLKQAAAPRRATPEFLDAALALLDYPAWRTFTDGRSAARAAALAGDCLAALLPVLTKPRKEAP